MKFDLVFEGGGAKGMVFVGAYEEFVNRKHTFGRLLGTSAGAITAALLAAGYTAREMLEALTEKENGKSVFAGFMGDPPPFTREQIRTSAIRDLLRNINIKPLPGFLENHMDDTISEALADHASSRHFFALVERGGWFSAGRFITWLQNKLDTGPWKDGRRQFSGMTLSQFFAATGIDLSVVASDTADSRLLVLNHRTAPGCPLVWAVRMSMSIPLVWDEVIWEKGWGGYTGRDIAGHAIVDGGILSNFPIELFISGEPQVTRLMGLKQDNAVLGLLIDESLPVPQPPATKGILLDVDVKPGELKTVKRLRRLIDTMTGAHDKMVIDEFEDMVVRLPSGGYGTTEFDMSDGRRSALVKAGRDAMGAYFEQSAAKRTPTKGLKAAGADKAQRVADRIAGRLLAL
ncbi:MAG: patatin-like phospholipase family protein [Deltaproteobacteria bacterium]|nr:patatin-like phospholipase family protein [Deltaproteobacteria bacterium]